MKERTGSMTEATESDDSAVSEDVAKRDTSSDAKKLASKSEIEEKIEALQEMGAPLEIIKTFKKMVVLIDKMERRSDAQSESLKKERSLRQNAELELSSMRVKMNLQDLVIQGYEREKEQEEDKRYENIEDAGEW